MAALILYAGIHGLLLDGWAKETKLFWVNIHALVGLSILALLLARIWWRQTHAPPELPAEVSELSRRASHPAHLLIYGLMLLTPIVGIVAFVWHGRVFNFGLFTVDLGVKVNSPVYHQAEDIHLWLTYGTVHARRRTRGRRAVASFRQSRHGPGANAPGAVAPAEACTLERYPIRLNRTVL